MNELIMSTILFVGILVFSTSCSKKDYTCKCESSSGGVTTTVIENSTKSAAEVVCAGTFTTGHCTLE